ncbi:MAG: hypothetical protein ACE5I2_03290 [Anaerolineae bacterium]
MSAYLAHPAVGNIATITLRRDPSGRSLIWGNIAAIAVTLVLSSIWILAVNGAIAPQSLTGETGTADDGRSAAGIPGGRANCKSHLSGDPVTFTPGTPLASAR